MKILQVHSFFYPHVGGSETYVLELSKHLVQRGHQVLVVTSKLPGTRDRENIEGLEVIRLPGIYLPRVPYFLFSPRLLGVLMQFSPQFDLIHSHVRFFLSTNCVALLRRLRKVPPFVLTLHATHPKPQIAWLRHLEQIYERTVGRFTVGSADALIALDVNVKNHAMRYGADGSKITLIPNGVDVTRFSNHRAVRHDTVSPVFQIGYIGNLVYRKGVQDLIQAVSLLPSTAAFQLKLVGDGPDRNRLVTLCQQQRIEPYVSFLGALDKNRIPEFLHSLDALVLPSLAEGMPTVVLEAMAGGVPVVATAVGATPTLIDSEAVGLLVPPQAPAAIAQALERLRANPDMRREIATNARVRVERLYSWEVIASQIEDVYRRATDG